MKITGIAAAAILSLLILPALIAQTRTQATTQTQSTQQGGGSNSALPAQMKSNNFFEVKNVSFNKEIDLKGQGEILQVEFEINNLLDVPQELYIHVMATNEEVVWKHNTFYHAYEKDGQVLLNFNKEQGRNLKKQNIDIRYFKSDPEDKSLFEYEVNNKTVLQKFPKNKKAGVDRQNNQAYKLNDKIIYSNEFLSNYRRNYLYFNHVTVLIFDDQENLVYRQIWSLDGKRR